MTMHHSGISFTLDRPRSTKLSRSELLCELEFVAARLGFVQFGKREFCQFGKYSVDPILNEFGNWTSAMIELQARLQSRGIEVIPRKRGIRNETIFAEMERIWLSLGHRPSRAEWHASRPSISYNLIRKRFDGWRNAAAAFIKFKEEAVMNFGTNSPDARASYRINRTAADNRVVRRGLRAQVLIRDCSTCCLCGRNPKTHPGLVLHVDHVLPYSKGGKTELGNLQTTCEDCNLGKGAYECERDDSSLSVRSSRIRIRSQSTSQDSIS